MQEKFEFIIGAIIEIAKADTLESLSGDVISISGVQENKDVNIMIKCSDNGDEMAFVTAKVDGKEVSLDIMKNILIDILGRTGLLDSKLKWKLDMVFSGKEFTL